MPVGLGLDATLRLSLTDHRALAREAAELGYTSLWTPASATGFDSFHLCAQWSAATTPIVEGGLWTGISVVPAPTWTVPTLAMQAATVGEITGGRFILGIGPGGLHDADFRRTFGIPDASVVDAMRDYTTALRRLLAGERVSMRSALVRLDGVALSVKHPPVPIYLAALGPRMLRLAGETADGVLPNWSGPEQIAWCRERVAEGARRANRDPATLPIVQYIRVCIDEDETAARRAFARAVMAYALARPGAAKDQGYRAHFARMGFDDTLTDLEARRDAGAPETELIDAFPLDLLRHVGYFGRPEGAAAAFRALAAGHDTAIVRVVVTRPGPDAVRATLRALAPASNQY